MNLHKDAARRKMILALLVASALLSAALCIVVRQREAYSQPSVSVTGNIDSNYSQTSDTDSLLTESTDTSATENTTVSRSDIDIPETGTTAPTSASAETTSTTAAVTATTTSAAEHEASSTVTTTTAKAVDRTRTECKGKLTVESDAANVRDDADGNAKFLREIYKGENYDVIAQKKSPTGILWYEMKFADGTTGYVSSSYVRYEGQVVDGKVYLTFDDGPSDNTRRILETLDKYGVKATFFVVYRKGFDDVYRDIVNKGHVIALHSYSHDYASIYSGEMAFYDDLNRIDNHVYNLTGVHSKIIRFPGGSSNTISKKYCKGVMSSLSKSVQDKGYKYYDWNVDSGDASGTTVAADKILNNIKNGVGSRREAIILMHDSKSKTTTADALPKIIDYLLSRGYAILPITDNTFDCHQKINN